MHDLPAGIFLAVSVTGLVLHSISLWRVMDRSGGGFAHRGIVRTILCRVLVALVYVAVGVTALLDSKGIGNADLLVFAFVQIVWWINSVADVRLRRRLERDKE